MEEVGIRVTTTDDTSKKLETIGGNVRRLGQAFGRLKGKLTPVRAHIRALAARVSAVSARLGPAAHAALNFGRALANLAGKARLAGRGLLGLGRFAGRLGGLLRGVLMAGIGAAIGGVFALARTFGAMRSAMEVSTREAGGAEGAMNDLASGASGAAEESSKAAEKIKTVFGAFGKVGEGFVQQQGKILSETTQTAEQAASAAADAAGMAEGAGRALGGATQEASRFGKALDRIGNAFRNARDKILRAIAGAITPALEKLADVMESPAFQEFITLLARDLAMAATVVADWFINRVIPAIQSLMEKVNEAGGPVNYLKEKWGELRATALMVLAIILAKVLEWSNSIRNAWSVAVGTMGTVMEGLVGIARGIWNRIAAVFERGINGIVDGINSLIDLYNTVAEAVGFGGIPQVSHVTIPRMAAGGIVTQPTLAVVGESGPEAVVPLNEGYGNITINVTVQAGGSGEETGWAIGESIVAAMRAQGLAPGVV